MKKKRFKHDSEDAQFLGRFREYDVYFENSSEHEPELGFIMLRYSNEESEYRSISLDDLLALYCSGTIIPRHKSPPLTIPIITLSDVPDLELLLEKK